MPCPYIGSVKVSCEMLQVEVPFLILEVTPLMAYWVF